MYCDDKILIAKNESPVYLLPKMANRHGLVAGATGTGKTITLKVLAESFSDLGVPVFMADIKGDLSGTCETGKDSPDMQKRIDKFGIKDQFGYKAYPVRFWDLLGAQGHPVRTTISQMGPLLLARLLGLNDTQSGILSIVFRVADDKNLLLIDIKDLKAMLQYVGENAKDLKLEYGNISSQSVGAILRSILTLEDQGADQFFGEPALDIMDWIQIDGGTQGVINILDCVELIKTPALYATFLLWLMSDLFEVLPEAGDLEKPKMVFFFDEAHLLFNDAPKVLIEKIEQVVRLIRSKGVGIYFISQSPTDMPDNILSQLGNRVQHALRAYSPAEQKAIKSAAETFRPNPAFKTEDAITDLGTGEALISCLDAEGRPAMVERCFILPPQSMMGPATQSGRDTTLQSSPLKDKYTEALDRESAYEDLMAQSEAQATKQADDDQQAQAVKEAEKPQKPAPKHQKTAIEKAADSALSTIGREVGRSLVRGLFDVLKRK